MRILSLRAHNIMRLVAVDITPDPNVVFVSGKNANGKTSVLSCIWLACQYAAAHKGIKQPIRKGEGEGDIRLEIGNGKVEFIVTREMSGDKTRLKIEAPSGASYPSPQAMLDKWIGALAFDPVEFAGMEDREQVKVLRDLLKLDFTELDAERKGAYEERTIVNRQLKEAEALLADLPKPDSKAPAEPLKIEDLQQKLREADARQSDWYAQRDKVQLAADEAARLEEDLVVLRAKVKEIQEEIENDEERLADLAVEVSMEKDKLNKIKLPDRGSILDQLSKVDEQNQAVRDRESYKKQKTRVEALAGEAADLSKTIDGIDQKKVDLLAEADMPIEGLTFEDDLVLYNSIPFSQCSQAEKLRVSLSMAMALNPELKVIRILDGSLLDSDNMAIIEEMAKEHDYQVWVEVVKDQPGLGIFIEDGEVVDA
jgi:hypothetical protein